MTKMATVWRRWRFDSPVQRTAWRAWYSFDADNDTDGENVPDYDFSFSCLAGVKTAITVPRLLRETVRLRGGPVDPLLSWRNARRFGESANWGKVQLTWVENDNNVDARPDEDPHERWEGVIASGTEEFPQVGGPPVGPYNNRYEADLDNSGKMKLYYLPEDRRIHLSGADTSWLKVDYNYDGKLDMEFRYRDADHDGVIDTWEVDVNGDGVPDRTAHVAHPHSRPVPLSYKSLTMFLQPEPGPSACRQSGFDRRIKRCTEKDRNTL
jgi:hypothetical protein